MFFLFALDFGDNRMRDTTDDNEECEADPTSVSSVVVGDGELKLRLLIVGLSLQSALKPLPESWECVDSALNLSSFERRRGRPLPFQCALSCGVKVALGRCRFFPLRFASKVL